MNGLKSGHQRNVEEFMQLAKQEVPSEPREPSYEVRLLRAKLILEEALETIRDGLGVDIWSWHGDRIEIERLEFDIDGSFSMAETIDGCCDIAVVTTGTLSACGIPDLPFQLEVDRNNLAKFGPGHSWREDGKLVKPPNHQPPQIERILSVLKELHGRT